ncbi:MAG: methyl-accepting chemotaxis protein [Desulfamplus sp.]
MFLNFITNKKFSSKNSLQPIKDMLNDIWNLSKRFPVDHEADNAESVETFNMFFEKLNSIVTRILKSVVNLASVSPELSKFSNEFKNRTIEQEKKVVDISKAANIMAERIENIAHNARSVSEDSSYIETEVTEALKLGKDSMKKFADIQENVMELVKIITVLEDNSKNITSIINLMNNIADETNILSLNARIEAAKNESGTKGFKVIAEEISKLAKQSKIATNDIKEQLNILGIKVNETVKSVKMVESNVLDGEKMINTANESLAGVYKHIGHLSKKMASIEESMNLQSKDVKSVSQDISSMEHFMDLQSGGVEQIFKAAQQINGACDDIIVDIGVFHLSGHEKAWKSARNLAANPNIISFNMAAQENALNSYLLQNTFIELAYITDKNGKQVVKNIYSPLIRNHEELDRGLGNDWSDREWFKMAMKTHTDFISKVYRSSATHCFCFTVSVPLFDAGTFAGVLGIDINIRDMLNI